MTRDASTSNPYILVFQLNAITLQLHCTLLQPLVRCEIRTHDLHTSRPTDEPLRIMGDVYGTLNGFTIDGQQIQAYAVVSDGRSYTSVAKIVPELGYDLQSLMPVSDIVGWMFAKPSIGVRNGFQMTGEYRYTYWIESFQVHMAAEPEAAEEGTGSGSSSPLQTLTSAALRFGRNSLELSSYLVKGFIILSGTT